MATVDCNCSICTKKGTLHLIVVLRQSKARKPVDPNELVDHFRQVPLLLIQTQGIAKPSQFEVLTIIRWNLDINPRRSPRMDRRSFFKFARLYCPSSQSTGASATTCSGPPTCDLKDGNIKKAVRTDVRKPKGPDPNFRP